MSIHGCASFDELFATEPMGAGNDSFKPWLAGC